MQDATCAVADCSVPSARSEPLPSADRSAALLPKPKRARADAQPNLPPSMGVWLQLAEIALVVSVDGRKGAAGGTVLAAVMSALAAMAQVVCEREVYTPQGEPELVARMRPFFNRLADGFVRSEHTELWTTACYEAALVGTACLLRLDHTIFVEDQVGGLSCGALWRSAADRSASV